jgi:hypothetical protein
MVLAEDDVDDKDVDAIEACAIDTDEAPERDEATAKCSTPRP